MFVHFVFKQNVTAANWALINQGEQQSSVIDITEAYLEHNFSSDGTLYVNDQMEFIVNQEMQSFVIHFAYGQAASLEITQVMLSMDTGDGFSIPKEVLKQNGEQTTDPELGLEAQYRQVRSSTEESFHLITVFPKGSKVRVSVHYQVKAAVERYQDLGVIRRTLVDEREHYQLDHLEAVFLFPDPAGGIPLNFTLYPLYRWQNPVSYNIATGKNEVRLELFNASGKTPFELVLGYPEAAFPDIPVTEDRLIQVELDKQLQDIQTREETIDRLSGWIDQYALFIVIALLLAAAMVILVVYAIDLWQGRQGRLHFFYQYSPLGISPSGLSFLLKRKVTGQDIYSVFIELTAKGILQYEKNVFSLAGPALDEEGNELGEPLISKEDRYNEHTNRWTVYGRKGAVQLDQASYVVYLALEELGLNQEGVTPSQLEKMSRTREYSTLYYKVLADYAKAVKEELSEKGLFDKHMRRGLLFFVLIVIYVAITITLFVLTWNWLFLLIFIPAIAMTMISLNIRSLSSDGHRALHQALGFKRYLSMFSSQDPVQRPADDVLVYLLVYAIAFACEDEYLDEVFKTHTQEELYNLGFYRQSGSFDLMRSSLASQEKDRQSTLLSRMKKRYREGRLFMIGVVFNSKHYHKL